MYGHIHVFSTKVLKCLIIFICFKWFKKILVAPFDEMAQKLAFYAKTMIHVPDTSVFITICLNDFFYVTLTLDLYFIQFHD